MYIRLSPGEPLTIASVPTRKEDKAVVKQSEPMSPARAQAGFTHTLANMVERSSTTLPATGPGTPTALASPVGRHARARPGESRE